MDESSAMEVVNGGVEAETAAPAAAPAVPEPSADTNMLMDLGFERVACEEALSAANGSTDDALEILLAKGSGDDAQGENNDIPPPPPAPAAKVAKSIRCIDTGKLFRNMTDAKIYAERTGHTNFEESDEVLPELTEAEKKQKVKEIRELLSKKRAARELEEKKSAIDAEKKRRAGGKGIGDIREQYEQAQRMREYEKRKKDKAAAKVQREKLNMLIAQDKAERAADKARRMGQDPKAAYDAALAKSMKKSGAKGGDSSAGKASVASAIGKLVKYRVGGDGLRALKTLAKMIDNLIQNPSEQKFRRINAQNPAFKKRVSAFLGGVEMLRAVGFVKNEEEHALILADDKMDLEVLKSAHTQIISQMNSMLHV